MLIRPTEEQLAEFGEPDFIIYNAGQFPANRFTKGMSSTTSVEINFKRMEMVILGTEYAGEMKKGVFSVMVCLLFAIGFPRDLYFISFLALPPTGEIRPAVAAFVRKRRHGQWRRYALLRSVRHWQDNAFRGPSSSPHWRRRARLV